MKILLDTMRKCDLNRPIRKFNQMKKPSYFSKPSQRKFMIILSAKFRRNTYKKKMENVDSTFLSCLDFIFTKVWVHPLAEKYGRSK